MTEHRLAPLPADARTVLFSGAKGGVGTTTVAVLHALALAGAGYPTMLTSASPAQLADCAALLATPGPGGPDGPTIDVNEAAALPARDGAQRYVVIDGGVDDVPASFLTTEDYLVTRPCYLAMRRAVAAPYRPHGIVLVIEPDRSLSQRDVEEVIGRPVVATMRIEAATARAIDAGLLTAGRRRRHPLVWNS